jgi:hypothetical protein
MAVKEKKMAVVSAAPTSSTNYYTVGAGKSAIVKNILISNSTASQVTVTMVIGGASFIFPVDKGTISLDMSLVMNAGDTINLYCSAASSAAIYVSGVEVT